MHMKWAQSWNLKRTFEVGSSLHNQHYRPDIDGIRAVAVLSVVLCHAAPDLVRGGFVGVDIFFVISGYLISNIIIRNISDQKFSIVGFYNRRIRRIFPALIVVILFLILMGWFCLFRSEFSSLGQHIMASSLFSENFLLWSEAGYFDATSTTKPTLHLWSLAIEEQFYLLWPAILFMANKFRMTTGFIIVSLLIVSFSINLMDIQSGSSSAYYSPLGRSWELMVGALLSYIEKVRPKILSYQKTLQSAVGALMIAAAILLTGPDRPFPGVWAILPTVGAALLISAGPLAFFNRNVLSAPPMVWCGLISYPLYLWHWPFLSFAHICADPSSTLPRVTALACVVAAVAAASLTFWFVERPFRGSVETPKKTVLLVAVMLLVLGGGAWNWYFLHGDYSISAHGKSTPLTSSEGRTLAFEALRAEVQTLIASGKQVVVLLDNPESQNFYLGRGSVRFGSSLKNFTANQTTMVDQRQVVLGDDMEKRFQQSGASLINPMTAVCVRSICKVTDDTGKPIYKDTAHFNPDWAIRNANFLDSSVIP